MSVMTGMKLGIAINRKLSAEGINSNDTLKLLLESIQGKGQFTVVEWSRLGKQLEVFGRGE